MSGANQQIMAPMAGKNGKLVIFQDGVKRLVDFETWSFKPNVTKHADGINGAEADELDNTFNHWEITAELFVRTIDAVRAYLSALAARQANTAPLIQQGGVRFNLNNGTRESLILVNLLWDDFDFKNSGRAAKKKMQCNFRCTKILEGKSA